MADSLDNFMDSRLGTSQATSAPLTIAGHVDEALANQDQAQKQNLQGSMFVAAQTDPDRHAKVLELSDKLKIPTGVVDRNFDELQKKNVYLSPDYSGMVKNNPGLSKWMEDHNNAAVAQDDIPALAATEDHAQDYSTFQQIRNAWDAGLVKAASKLTKVPSFAFNALTGAPSGLLANALGEQDPTTAPTSNVLSNYLDEKSKQFAQGAPIANESAWQNVKNGHYERAGANLALQFVQSAPDLAVLLGSSIAGMPMAGLAPVAAGAGAESADQAIKAGIDPTIATAAGVAHAGIFGAMGELKINAVENWANEITEMYGRDVSKQVVGAFAKNLAYHATSMGAQQTVAHAADQFADYATGINPHAFDNFAQQSGDSFLSGASVGALLALPGAGLSVHRNMQEANATREAYTSFGKSLEATKTVGRVGVPPDLVNHMTEGTGLSDLAISPEAVDTYFQKKNLNPVKTMQEMGISDAYSKAKEAGTDLKIPLADWSEKFIGTEHYDGLKDDVKFVKPDGTFTPSMNEARAALAEHADNQTMLEEQAKAGIKSPLEQSAEDDAAKIAERLQAQYEETGMSPAKAKATAEQQAEFYRTQGINFGKGVEDITKTVPVPNIVGEGNASDGGQTFNQDDFNKAGKLPKGFGGRENEVDQTSHKLPKDVKITRSGPDHETIPEKSTRAEKTAFAKKIADRISVTNSQANEPIKIDRDVPEKAVSHVLGLMKIGNMTRNEAKQHLEALQYLPELVKTAVHLTDAPDKDGDNLGWQTYFAPLHMNGKSFNVKMQVERTNGGFLRVHNYELVKPSGVTSYGVATNNVGQAPAESLSKPSTDLLPIEDYLQHVKDDRAKYSFFQQPENAPAFYSKLERTVQEKMGNSASPEQINGMLKEIKPEERKWSGLDEFLKGKEKISKQELLDHLRGNALQIEEVTKNSAESSPLTESEQDRLHTLIVKHENGGLIPREHDELALLEKRENGQGVVDQTKFSQFVLPGGENYREVLFRMPGTDIKPLRLEHEELFDKIDSANFEIRKEFPKAKLSKFDQIAEDKGLYSKQDVERLNALEKQITDFDNGKSSEYHSSHFDESNILAHTRLNDRTTSDGDKALHVEEIQSDWHQAGRKKGYAATAEERSALSAEMDNLKAKKNQLLDGPRNGRSTDDILNEVKPIDARIAEIAKASKSGVPDAPFRKTWHEFVLKRLIREAAEKGYDRLTWTTGEQQGLRYPQLVDHVNSIEWHSHENGKQSENKTLLIDRKEGGDVVLKVDKDGTVLEGAKDFKGKDLSEIIGKDPAKKIMEGGAEGTLKGDGLIMGAAGMKGFYDKILPDFANKFGKKYGARVEDAEIRAPILGEEPESLSEESQSIDKLKDQRTAIENEIAAPDSESVTYSDSGSDKHFERVKHPDLPIVLQIDRADGSVQAEWNGNRLIKHYDSEASAFENISQDTKTFLDKEISEREAHLAEVNGNPTTETVHSLPITPELRKAALEEGFSLFQKGDGNNPLGQASFFPDGETTIKLFKSQNASTALHESGHFYLEALGRLAEREDAPQQVKDDYATTLKYLGVESRGDITTAEHEKFAEGFTKYLMEGKAPSERLRSVFERFKNWLTALYQRSSQYFGKDEITPEIRQVFDRLLATPEEIKAAQEQTSQNALFPNPKEVGMSDAEAAKYSKAIGDARSSAEEELTSKLMQEIKRQQTSEWNVQRDGIKDEIAKEVDARPEQVALAALQKGTLPNGEPLAAELQIKIDRSSIVDEFGKERLAELPKPYVYAKEGGVPVDAAADMFGFSSGDELLKALSTAEKRDTIINTEADKRMQDIHGNMMEDGQIHDEAVAAVHNDKSSELMRKELEHLASNDFAKFKGLVKRIARPIPTIEDVRAQAEDQIGRTLFKDLNPTLFQRGETKAGKQAMDLFLKGDFEGAFDAKKRQLLSHELYRAAVDARDDANKIVDYMNTFSKTTTRERLGKAGGNYLEQVDSILERFDFRKGVSLTKIEDRKSLLKWVNDQAAQGYDTQVPEKLLNEAFKQHYKDTSYEDLSDIRDTVKNIANLARLKNELLTNKKFREIQDARDSITSTIKANHDIKSEPPNFAPEFADRIKEGVRGFMAEHTRMEFLFEHLDGGKAHGPVWESLFLPLAEAEDHESKLMGEATQKLGDIFNEYTPKERALWYLNKTHIPEIDNSLNKANMLAVALNTGNKGNMDALREGYKWTPEQVKAITDHLDARDWKVVQAVWDHIDSYWPQIEAMEKRLNGIAPKQVERVPFTNEHGTFEGGYYPILFDSKLSWKQSLLEAKQQTEDLFGGNWAKAMTDKGHTFEREGSGGKPIKLDLSGLTEHVSNVLHDLTHREAIIDVHKLINSGDVRETIQGAVGKEMYKQLNPWLAGIAGEKNGPSSNQYEALLSRARGGATIVNLGFKVTSGLKHTLSFAMAVNELGPEYAAKGVAAVFGNPTKLRDTWEFIASRSENMKGRFINADRDVRDAMKEMNIAGVNHGLGSVVDFHMEGIKRSYFTFMGYMDLATSMPTWMGAYSKALDGKMENINGGDEKGAIEYADNVVRTTKGAGSAKDLAGIQRGSESFKLFTMFYSQLSLRYNNLAKISSQFQMSRDVPRLMASLALVWFAPAVLETIVMGKVPNDDEQKNLGKWTAKKEALYPLESMIGVRDAVNFLDRRDYVASPAFDAAKTLGETMKAGFNRVLGEKDEFNRNDVHNAVNTAGYFLQLPTRQMLLTGEYLHDWMTGVEKPANPVEGLWHAAVTGKPKAQ